MWLGHRQQANNTYNRWDSTRESEGSLSEPGRHVAIREGRPITTLTPDENINEQEVIILTDDSFHTTGTPNAASLHST